MLRKNAKKIIKQESFRIKKLSNLNNNKILYADTNVIET